MEKTVLSAKITLWANRAVAAILGILLFTLPSLLQWYSTERQLSDGERLVVTVGFYCCFVAIAIALWSMDALLRSILRQEIFTRQNVRRIHTIQWCCAATALICLPVTLAYYPMIFVTLVMGFLCLAVSVVARVMDTAVIIREENDLTI